MPGELRFWLTLAVCAGTLLCVLTRPRQIAEAWWASGGGALMLLLRLETPQQAWRVTRTGQDALLFLLSLLLLSLLLLSALLGTDIGPNLTLSGSLATLLVLASARRKGEDIKTSAFLKIGLLVTPLTLLAATLTLWLTFLVVH